MTDRKNKRLLPQLGKEKNLKFHNFQMYIQPPQPPLQYPKTLHYQLNPNRHTKPKILSMQINEMHQLGSPCDLGIPQTLLNMESYKFKINNDSSVKLNEKDKILIEECISIECSEEEETETKQKRTQKAQNQEINRNAKRIQELRQEQQKKYQGLSFESFGGKIERTFAESETIKENADLIEHPTKPGVKAKRIIPIEPFDIDEDRIFSILNQREVYLSLPKEGTKGVILKENNDQNSRLYNYNEMDATDLLNDIRNRAFKKKMKKERSKLKKHTNSDDNGQISEDIDGDEVKEKQKSDESESEDQLFEIEREDLVEKQLQEATDTLKNSDGYIVKRPEYESDRSENEYDIQDRDIDQELQKLFKKADKKPKSKKKEFEINDESDDDGEQNNSKQKMYLLKQKQLFDFREITNQKASDFILAFDQNTQKVKYTPINTLFILDRELKKQQKKSEFSNEFFLQTKYMDLTLVQEKALAKKMQDKKEREKMEYNQQYSTFKKVKKPTKNKQEKDAQSNPSQAGEVSQEIDLPEFGEDIDENEIEADNLDDLADLDEEEDDEEEDEEDNGFIERDEDDEDRRKKKKHKKDKKQKKDKKKKKLKKQRRDHSDDGEDKQDNSEEDEEIYGDQDSMAEERRKKQNQKLSKQSEEIFQDGDEEDEDDDDNIQQPVYYDQNKSDEDEEEQFSMMPKKKVVAPNPPPAPKQDEEQENAELEKQLLAQKEQEYQKAVDEKFREKQRQMEQDMKSLSEEESDSE